MHNRTGRTNGAAAYLRLSPYASVVGSLRPCAVISEWITVDYAAADKLQNLLFIFYMRY